MTAWVMFGCMLVAACQKLTIQRSRVTLLAAGNHILHALVGGGVVHATVVC